MVIQLTASDEELIERFFSLEKREDVATLLELSSYRFLEYYLFVLPFEERYRRFEIPKRHGNANRIILEPVPNLKIIQQKLLQVLRLAYRPKPSVHGFVEGRSIVTNAQLHVKRNYVLNLDLENFFPSIHFGRVHGMFMAYPYNFNAEVATILAQICSLRWTLPQGAPTSPVISNMLCAKMDSQLQRLAKENRCYYTRFADDLTLKYRQHDGHCGGEDARGYQGTEVHRESSRQ
jgi:RNA-directed DNA polymerase